MPTLNAQSGGYLVLGVASLNAYTLPVASGSYAVTGTVARLGTGIVASSGSYAITGSSIRISKITAAPGSYQLQGQVAALLLNTRKILAGNGSYIVTGTTATRLQYSKPYTNGVYAITGTAVTLSKTILPRSIIPATGVYTVTGASAVLFTELLIDAGDYNVTGTAVALRPGKRIVANSGSYSISTLVPVLLKQTRRLTAVGTTYSITNSAVVGLVFVGDPSKTIDAEGGSYTYTGTAVTVVSPRTLIAGTTTYTLTGTAVTTKNAFKFPAGSTTYTVSGSTVNLTRGVTILQASSGGYSLNGDPVTATHSARLFADSVNYSYSGTSATLRHGQKAEIGTYALTGSAVTFRHTIRLIAGSSTYTLTGISAALLYPVHLFPVDSGVYNWTGFSQLLIAPKVFQVLAGSYTLTGDTTELRITHIEVDNGTYVLTGSPVTLRTTHQGRWKKQPPRGPRFTKQLIADTSWDQQPTGPGVT